MTRKVPSIYSLDPETLAGIKAMFPRDMSPEEYAARHAHTFYCFGFELLDLQDDELQSWLLRVADIIFARNGAPTLDELRRKYLSPEEIDAIEKERREDW